MTIEIVYFEGCPNWRLAEQRVREALRQADRADAEVRLRLVESPAEAQQAGMHGSPTILVDGRDPFPTAAEAIWSCRLYPNSAGFEGAPSVGALTEVLR